MGGILCIVVVLLIVSPLLASRRTQAVVLLMLCGIFAVIAYEQQTNLIAVSALVGAVLIMLVDFLGWLGVVLVAMAAAGCTLVATQSPTPPGLGVVAFLAWITALGMAVTLIDA